MSKLSIKGGYDKSQHGEQPFSTADTSVGLEESKSITMGNLSMREHQTIPKGYLVPERGRPSHSESNGAAPSKQFSEASQFNHQMAINSGRPPKDL